VVLRKSGDGRLVLSVGDDGIGMSADFDPAKSDALGVRLVLTLVEQLDGHLEILATGGTTFRITFPLDAAA
jgi:two-component sensor histidine kinase